LQRQGSSDPVRQKSADKPASLHTHNVTTRKFFICPETFSAMASYHSTIEELPSNALKLSVTWRNKNEASEDVKSICSVGCPGPGHYGLRHAVRLYRERGSHIFSGLFNLHGAIGRLFRLGCHLDRRTGTLRRSQFSGRFRIHFSKGNRRWHFRDDRRNSCL
jgi:hypothetical protein